MSRSDARCATPYIYSGELQIRPEVDAALAALKDKPYTAIPSWKNDGTWELWTVEGDGETEPCIISGPSTTYPSESAAWLRGGLVCRARLNLDHLRLGYSIRILFVTM